MATRPPDGGHRSITVASRFLPARHEQAVSGRPAVPPEDAMDTTDGPDATDSAGLASAPPQPPKKLRRLNPRRRKELRRQFQAGQVYMEDEGVDQPGISSPPAPQPAPDASSALHSVSRAPPGLEDALAAVPADHVSMSPDNTVTVGSESPANPNEPSAPGQPAPGGTWSERERALAAGHSVVVVPSGSASTVDNPGLPAVYNSASAIYSAPVTVRLVHNDDGTVCNCDLYCRRGRHPFCYDCRLHDADPHPCVHLRDFSDELDFDC